MDATGTSIDPPRGGRSVARHDDPGGGAGSGGAAVDVIDGGGLLGTGTVAWVEQRARAALGYLGASGEVRVKIVDDAEMARAHEQYGGVAGTTDVLTFDLAGGAAGRGGPLDVDILVCADEARRQAAVRGHAPEREVLLYIVHGVLHCLGHDDHDEARAGEMHRREDEVLNAVGVGATYAPTPAGRPVERPAP